MIGDSWCPFNCNLGDKKLGYMIEVAKFIFETQGHNIDYQIDTWEKSIKDVRSGKVTALIATTLYDAPDFIFPNKDLGFSKDCFFVKEKDPFEFNSIKDLEKRKLGIVQSYAYSTKTQDFIKENKDKLFKAQGIDPLLELHKAIKDGKIDTIVENPIVFNYFKDHTKLEFKYEEAGCTDGLSLYIAFSPKNPRSREFAKILSDGIEKLRKDGTLDKILSKYDLKEWR
jgi:polar amino acid transport system substrate-binding protein